MLDWVVNEKSGLNKIEDDYRRIKTVFVRLIASSPEPVEGGHEWKYTKMVEYRGMRIEVVIKGEWRERWRGESVEEKMMRLMDGGLTISLSDEEKSVKKDLTMQRLQVYMNDRSYITELDRMAVVDRLNNALKGVADALEKI
jgi:hypothetical protein